MQLGQDEILASIELLGRECGLVPFFGEG